MAPGGGGEKKKGGGGHWILDIALRCKQQRQIKSSGTIQRGISSPSSGCSVNAIFKGGKFAAKRCNSFWSVGQRRFGKTISFYEHA
ncbi:hypothetical protein T02_3086 [Trichinella nativa]|uniref:Uncharacterized protein n=1 Tax=Trichinella nativa TaxID=6335 RepID=A0A0V1LUE8_9BILA|nr:hypothetical protein T02_3086 [Trichinella nativa]